LHKDTSQSYRIITTHADVGELYGLPDHVTFSTPDSKELPLPDSRFLELHAACARVVHLSGAAEYIDYVGDCMNDGGIAVLSEDGTSADILTSYLRVAQSQMTLVR
jgi:hypothetical protein